MADIRLITLLLLWSVNTSISSEFLNRPPQFSSIMNNVTVVAGREARLTCVVENLDSYKVAWVHYGESGPAVLTAGNHVLTTNRRVSVQTERDYWMLIIANATIADRGQYMCQLSTVPPQKLFGFLNIVVPPHISKPPNDVVSKEGQNISLNCEAIGDPKPKITWRREDGGPISINETLVESVKGTLSLSNLMKKSAGAYLCVASNGIPPAVSARSQIFVKYAPVINREEGYLAWAMLGDEVSIKCPFKAYPKPTIKWKKINGISETDLITLIDFSSNDRGIAYVYFKSVVSNDFGGYMCTVLNSVGQSSATFSLSEKITTTTAKSTTENIFAESSTASPIDIRPNRFDNGQVSNMKFERNYSIRHFTTPSAGLKIGDMSHKENRNQLEDTNPPNRFIQESYSDHKIQHHASGISYCQLLMSPLSCLMPILLISTFI